MTPPRVGREDLLGATTAGGADAAAPGAEDGTVVWNADPFVPAHPDDSVLGAI